MADDDLLTRLNALKAPTKAPRLAEKAVPHPSIRPANAVDDIASRFRRLASGSSLSPGQLQTSSTTSTRTQIDDIVDDLPSERIHNDEDDQSLNDLLKELGADQSSWMNVPEEDRVAELLKEAKAVLPQGHAHQEDDSGNGDGQSRHRAGQQDLEVESEEDARCQDEQDDKDADDYVAQVMADIELQKKLGTFKNDDDSGLEGDEVDESKGQEAEVLEGKARSVREPTPLDSLPSAPSTAPVLATVGDDELEARFASLSLPSTPSNKPNSTKPSSRPKANANLPQYTDEDIESWCVICNDDATLRCLGCDGDVYCQECWNEGHRSPEAGYEEMTHKAVIYTRGQGKKKKSLAAA